MFKSGDKVICVETGSGVKEGEVYTVSDISQSRNLVYLEGKTVGAFSYRFKKALTGDKEPTKKPCKASETMIGGTHYTSMGIQPFEFTYANYGYMGLKAAVHTKVNKYLGRVKDNEIEQLKKARHCIDILIEKAELEATK